MAKNLGRPDALGTVTGGVVAVIFCFFCGDIFAAVIVTIIYGACITIYRLVFGESNDNQFDNNSSRDADSRPGDIRNS